MGKRILYYLLISLFFGGLNFYLTGNIVTSIIVLAMYVLFFVLLYEPRYKKYKVTIDKTKECVSFINNFIITLSINNSVSTTFNALKDGFSESLNEQVETINNLTDEEKVFYLDNYFQNPIYSVFTKLVKQHIYNGGNILDTCRLLIFDSRIVEDNLENFLSVSKKKLFEFCIMWGFCFIILIVMKIFLGDYYIKISSMSYFPWSLFLINLVFVVCLFLVTSHMLNLRFINKELVYEVERKNK